MKFLTEGNEENKDSNKLTLILFVVFVFFCY